MKNTLNIMHILVITQYFWPEQFRINDLVLGLKDKGHQVTVLTGKPNYPKGKFYEGYNFWNRNFEIWNDINIYRSAIIPRGKGGSLRLALNYLSFSFLSLITAFIIKKRPDVIFVYEPSPVTVGFPAILSKWRFKSPIYFWVQDIWPDSIASAGNVKSPAILNVLEKVTRWIYSKCDKVLIQSRGFEERILSQNVPKSKIVYFPNWTESYYVPVTKDEKYSQYFESGFNLVFAGNIGESQDFETLIECASIVYGMDKEVFWTIIGDGRMKEAVQARVSEKGLDKVFKMIGSFPSEEMPAFFSHADALLVSLKKDPLFAITIPSKIQSYLACGRPIITSLDGEGSRIVAEAEAGLVSEAGNPECLARVIIDFVNLDPQIRQQMGKNAYNYYQEKFERNMLIEKLIGLFRNHSNE